jgi:LmbE family N-acetylglucosaminyl deacetylase
MNLKNKNILVVIAHPDDETIGCGGFLSKAITKGAACKVVLTLKRTNKRENISWEDEILQFEKACKILGVIPIVIEELVDDNIALHHTQKLALLIKEYIEWSDIVLSHWKDDLHHAHQALNKAVEISTRPFKNNKTVLCFEVSTSTDQGFENSFSPNCYVELSRKDVLKKMQAMAEYYSEIACGRSPKDLELLTKVRGMQAGLKYAEAYKIVRHYIK